MVVVQGVQQKHFFFRKQAIWLLHSTINFNAHPDVYVDHDALLVLTLPIRQNTWE